MPPPPPMAFLSASSLAEMMPASGEGGLAWWGADATYGEGKGGCVSWAHGGFMDGVRTHVWLWPAVRVGLVHLQNWEGDYRAAVQHARAEVAERTGLCAARSLRMASDQPDPAVQDTGG